MRLVAAASFSVQLVAASLIIFCLNPGGVYHSSMNAGAEGKDVNVGCSAYVYAFHLMLIAVLLMVVCVCVFGSSQEFAAIILPACSMLIQSLATQLLFRCC